MCIRKLATGLSLALGLATVWPASLTVPNSGFETPVLGGGQFQYAPSGATWAIVNGGGMSGNGSAFTGNNPNAPEGVQVAFLQGPGRVSQTIAGFSAGVTYTITFSAAQRNLAGSSGQTWNIQIDGTMVGTFAPPQSANTYTDYSTTFTTTAGSHEVAFQASNLNGGDNTVFIDNVRITYAATGTGTGLKGDYFTNTGLSGSPALSRTDATVNFNWSSTPPDPVIPLGNYSVRWTGQVQPQAGETYTFYTSTDDGARLWVNGIQLVNDWTDHPDTERSGTITLTANQMYSLTMEYYQGAGSAVAKLSWSSASTPKAIIPQTQLYVPASTPAAPSALAATALGTNSIRLTWTDNANNESGFAIERKTGAGGTYAQVASVGANVTTYTNTGLAANTQYYYRARATNAAGASAYSAEANATTQSMVPSAPSALTATTEATNRIRLNWTDNANNESGFAIERKTGAGGTYAQVASVGANVTTYTNTGLAANTQYYYRARATNASGASAYSAEANATTFPFPPSAPSALAATALSSTSIRINWTDNANNETQFKIERKTGAGGTYSEIATVNANITTYTNTGLSPSTQYYYRVRANNTGGDSAFSSEANATTLSGCGALPTPFASQDIGAVGFAGGACYSGTTFTIRASGTDIWDAADAFHFVYQTWTGNVEVIARVVSVQNTDSWAKSGVMIRESLNADSIHAFMPITPGNGSSFQRRTTTGGGSSLTSPPDSVTAPYWVRLVRSGTTFTGYKSSDGSNWVQVGSDTISMASTFRVGLAVTAHNNGVINTSVVDNVIVRVPATPPPAAPSGLVATPVSTSQINLSWTDNANNETGFEVERKQGAGGTYAFIGGTGANVTSFPDSGLAANTTYFYRVRAINTGGNSAYSAEASATTQSSGTGVGLQGEYFSNQNLTGSPVLTRTDPVVDFNWGTSAPHASVPADNFSVRWSGKVQPQFTETYTFYTYNDDGARLWVNGVQLVNDWTGHGATEFSGNIALTGGQQYSVVMEYFDSGGDAVARLSWSSPSTPKAVIPQSRLYLPAPPTIPAAPSALAATAVSASQINLTWTDNANNETQFKVERKTGAGGTYSQIATPGANSTSHSDTTVSPNTTYYYRVRANNSAGDSAFSGEANATTPSPAAFQNPGVQSQIVNGLRYEWIPTRDVNFQIQADGKVKIIAPLTKQSFNGANTCQRFIYDHAHTRLSAADASALFGSGLMLPVGNHGFAILWLNATSYDDVLARGWDLTANPATYPGNSTKVDYFNLSIVPVTPPAPPSGQVQEIILPWDLQRVSWLPHYQLLPENLNLPANKGFGITRMLMDIPLDQVYQKVTQIQYMYGFLDLVPNARKWKVMRAYPGESNTQLIQQAPVDENFGYMSQMDEDFGNMGDPNHLQRAQQVLQGIYQRLVNERGITSPNQTRMYDDYFSDFGGYSVSENFRFGFNAANMVTGLSSQTEARQQASGAESAYFSQGAINFRNWIQGGYLDSFERIPEAIRIYNEIYNFEKRFMAAPDRRVAKMGWANAEGVNSEMFRHGTESRLHFANGDIIRSVEITWPFHMMLNEGFWTVLLGNDYYLWHSSVPLVTGIQYWGDSWAAGAGPSLWQPTGGSITTYDPNNPSHPARTNSPLGQFPTNPHLGESGGFAGAWLVSQLTTASERISQTMEYCPFSYRINGGSVQAGYYNGNNPSNGSLGNAKLSRYGVANYGQANIVKTFEARKPICIYTAGANGGAVIYHNPYSGLADVNDITITTPAGQRTFQVTGNSLHVFYLN
jgi:hypothetical protein